MMKSLGDSLRFKKAEIQKAQESPPKKERKVLFWQDYAARVIKEFGVNDEKDDHVKVGIRAAIFRYAKRNSSYLEGKVELCREKFGNNLHGKGRYLMKLFSTKKPWET